MVKVRLSRKLAECIDGVDLSDRRVGEVIDLPPEEARLIVAEQWAEPADPQPARVVDPAARRDPRRTRLKNSTGPDEALKKSRPERRTRALQMQVDRQGRRRD